MKPIFVLDQNVGPLGSGGYPLPSAVPDVVQRLIDERVAGDEDDSQEFVSIPPAAPDPPVSPQQQLPVGAAPSVTPLPDLVPLPSVSPPPTDAELAAAAAAAAEAPVFPGTQFEGAFPRPPGANGASRVVDLSVPAPPPIVPGAEAYADLKVPGTLEGSPYSSAFTLQQLREATATDRYVYEGRRIRSATPCRTCAKGSEFFGLAELKSQTFTGIARRIVCDYLKADVTSNVVLHCQAYERDEEKVAGFKTIRAIEADLRARFKLTAAPATRWDAEEIEEERRLLAAILGEDHPAVAPSVEAAPPEAPPLW